MLKINTIEDKDGFRLNMEVYGDRGAIAQELSAVLNELAIKDEELVVVALELYLAERGF